MDTIFRFVTVRNPRKPTRNELDTGFVVYDRDLQAPLIDDVATKRRDEEDLAVARSAIREYKEDSDFIHRLEDIEARAPGLVAWVDWLAAEAHRLTTRQFEDFRNANPLTVQPDTLRWLWDNLLAYTYAGGAPEVRETIIWAIRVAKLLQRHSARRPTRPNDGPRRPNDGPRRPDDDEPSRPDDDEPSRPDDDGPSRQDDDELRRLAQSTVLLPSSVHVAGTDPPNNQPDDHEPGEPSPDPAPELAAAYERIEQIQAAAEELTRHYRDEVERVRASEVDPLKVPRVTGEGRIEPPDEELQTDQFEQERPASESPQLRDLNERVYGRLSEGTRGLLNELGIPGDVRVPYVLQRLQEATGELARSTVKEGKAGRRVVQAGGAFWTVEPTTQPSPEPPPKPVRPDEPYRHFFVAPECKVKPLGVGDFRRVEQRLWCYEPGEVAHIENVLIGESKERSTRRLRRSEELITLATEEERTEEHDTQTTDRFEMQKETSRVVEQELSFELGVQTTATYGPVRINADANFATSTSTTQSDRTASNYAREVTDRALERVVTTVREERTTRLIEEFEESNKHALDNTGGDAHIVGLYRWVDKIYEAKIVNYGKRLMFEFLVPEPGAFHLHAMTKAPIESTVSLEKPIDPRSSEITTVLGLPPLTSHEAITEANYAFYAAAYEAKVDPPPLPLVTTGKAYHRDGMDHNVQFADSKNDLKVPEGGYEALSFQAPFGLHSEFHDGGSNWVTIAIGRRSRFTTVGGTFAGALDGEDDIVPVVVMGRTRFYALDIEVVCGRTAVAFDKWQIKTFNAILDAYNDQLAAYNNALAEARARAGVEIAGTNPLRNRDIERFELQKGSLRLLAQQCQSLWSDAMSDDQECGYPEFDCCEAIRDGSYVQFVEQAFEWKLMTYLFYPYFWGRKCNWEKIYQLDDADPLFLSFLQAGYARVVVPVREGYEEAAMRFLADGTLWNGGSVPGIDDPMYVSIANELKEPVGEVDPAVEPWEIRVPTTLTALQCESGCVEGRGLPCPREEARG